MKHYFSKSLATPFVRLGISLFSIVGCVVAIWLSAEAGFSRLLTKSASVTANAAVSKKAVELMSADPESHLNLAAVMYHFGKFGEAAKELEYAVSLRPRDHYAWLELGIVRDQLEETAAALSAFDESVRLAPYYASPRWQRGNLLLRMGRYDEAFADLRRAAQSNAELVPNVIDLAWGVSKGNMQITEDWAEVNTSKARIAFARLLLRRGKTLEGIQKFKEASPVSKEITTEFVQKLITAEAFPEAFELWQTAHFGKDSKAATSIYDGGFEAPLSLAEWGFGWRVSPTLVSTRLSLDASQKHTGGQSLLVEFLGDSNPDTPTISQYIIVEPSQRYRVTFAVRTQDLVSGGLPLAVVSDATGAHARLGQSPTLRQGTSEWQSLSFDFATASDTRAVAFSLQRLACTTSPCPAFGSIWLDSVSLEQVR
jgi:tetratricopeptide repeat protein